MGFGPKGIVCVAASFALKNPYNSLKCYEKCVPKEEQAASESSQFLITESSQRGRMIFFLGDTLDSVRNKPKISGSFHPFLV